MARLSPRFHRRLEDHLAQERIKDALCLLRAAIDEDDDLGADLLRYLGVTGLLAGYTEKSGTILERALDEALAERDVVAAIDVLRRLDAIGGDVDELWSKALSAVVRRGFEKVESSGTLVEPTEDTATDNTVEGLFTECLKAVTAREPRTDERPFQFVPLLSDLSNGDLRAAVKSLDIRVVQEGERLGSVCGGAPGWAVSGSVEHAGRDIALPSGTLLLPDHEGPIAASPTRLLVFDAEVWASLEGDAHVDAALADYARRLRLVSSLRSSSFYRSLASELRTEFIGHLNCSTIVNEAIIIRGQSVRGLFVLLHGTAMVSLSENGERSEVARLQPGDVFGELDVLTAGGAEYDVHADGEVDICFIDVDVARELLSRAPNARSRLVELRETRKQESRKKAAAGASTRQMNGN